MTQIKFGKGHKLETHAAYLKTLGITVEYMEHLMTQIPSLFIESVRRLQYSPFVDEDGTFIAYNGGRSSRLVKFIVDKATNGFQVEPSALHVLDKRDTGMEAEDEIPCVYITYIREKSPSIPTELFVPFSCHPVIILPAHRMHSGETKCTTRIDGTRRTTKTQAVGKQVIAHGKKFELHDMPLYAQDGEGGLDCVYPIFDWTDDQVLAACILYDIEFPK